MYLSKCDSMTLERKRAGNEVETNKYPAEKTSTSCWVIEGKVDIIFFRNTGDKEEQNTDSETGEKVFKREVEKISYNPYPWQKRPLTEIVCCHHLRRARNKKFSLGLFTFSLAET